MIRTTHEYFNNNPYLGFITGVISWILTCFQFLTNEYVLKVIGAIGIWAGALVAVINLLCRVSAWVTRRRHLHQQNKI